MKMNSKTNFLMITLSIFLQAQNSFASDLNVKFLDRKISNIKTLIEQSEQTKLDLETMKNFNDLSELEKQMIEETKKTVISDADTTTAQIVSIDMFNAAQVMQQATIKNDVLVMHEAKLQNTKEIVYNIVDPELRSDVLDACDLTLQILEEKRTSNRK